MGKCKVLIALYALLGLSPKDILERTNIQLCKGNESGLFVTCWLGIFTFSTGELKFANAGHPFPVLYQENKFSFLNIKPNFILGGMDGISYVEHSINLEKGDRIFIYTDGITEATDSNNQLFGDDRLLEAINKTKNLSAPDTLKKIREQIDLFVGNAEQFDDLTMLCIEYRGKEDDN
jgi:sigma-B regulation protein RsbU (phosphoserine phosphatase)